MAALEQRPALGLEDGGRAAARRSRSASSNARATGSPSATSRTMPSRAASAALITPAGQAEVLRDRRRQRRPRGRVAGRDPAGELGVAEGRVGGRRSAGRRAARARSRRRARAPLTAAMTGRWQSPTASKARVLVSTSRRSVLEVAAELARVHARAEGAAGAGENDAADVVVVARGRRTRRRARPAGRSRARCASRAVCSVTTATSSRRSIESSAGTAREPNATQARCLRRSAAILGRFQIACAGRRDRFQPWPKQRAEVPDLLLETTLAAALRDRETGARTDCGWPLHLRHLAGKVAPPADGATLSPVSESTDTGPDERRKTPREAIADAHVKVPTRGNRKLERFLEGGERR